VRVDCATRARLFHATTLLARRPDGEVDAMTHTVAAQALESRHAALHCEVSELVLEHGIESRKKPAAKVDASWGKQPFVPCGVDPRT